MTDRSTDGAERDTAYVSEAPKRLLGNLLIDGPDGQCAYIYSGISERCTNDAVAHTYMEHGHENVRVEMCAKHAREEVPDPTETEQQELAPDGGTPKTGGDRVAEPTREWIEETLERLDMVEWDRFVVGVDPGGHGRYVNVYGWIERAADEYKDFVQLRFFPESDVYGFTTSSDRYTDEIHRRLFGDEPDGHNPCQRVEDTFDVDNAIQLTDQTTLGGGPER